jgi:23S rRNA pseudouridine2605 synthase
MFSAIGHPVLKLKRIEYGPVQLKDLPFGQFRYLTPEEVGKLKKQVRSPEFGVRSKISKDEEIGRHGEAGIY